MFDIDGTLFANEEPLWRIENGIAVDLGYSPVTHEQHREHWYKPTKERLARTYSGIDAEMFFCALTRVMPSYFEKRMIDAVSDDNARVLDELKDRGWNLGIVTSRKDFEIEHLLGGDYGLKKWFDPIYHAGNLKYLKPDPRAFEQALAHFSVDPREALYVGDLVTDGFCAKEAGLGFIAVLEEGICTKRDFDAVGADYFADRFYDILNYLK